jgi:hypothetical protein
MEFPQEQITELQRLFPGTQRYDEGGYIYFYLPNVLLPSGCVPERVDALLCPMMRDGYPSRLFFAQVIATSENRNWNGTDRILERLWHAISWRVEPSLRLVQMVGMHMSALYARAV